jgi:hypothetical protein
MTATMTQTPNQAAPAKDPWTMEVGGGSGGGEYVLCPPGNYPGVIVGIFDLGHQTIKTKDKGEQEIRKLALVYELAKQRPDGKPFILAETYTWSMRDNSYFYALAAGVTGKQFKTGDTFSPLYLLDGPVMVNVTNTSNGDKTYHNVNSVNQFPDGFPAPKAVNKPVSWSVMTGDPFPAGLDWLPFVYGKPIKTLAEASSEFKARSQTLQGPGQGPGDSIPF